jgi:hypothetical protein
MYGWTRTKENKPVPSSSNTPIGRIKERIPMLPNNAVYGFAFSLSIYLILLILYLAYKGLVEILRWVV